MALISASLLAVSVSGYWQGSVGRVFIVEKGCPHETFYFRVGQGFCSGREDRTEFFCGNHLGVGLCLRPTKKLRVQELREEIGVAADLYLHEARDSSRLAKERFRGAGALLAALAEGSLSRSWTGFLQRWTEQF